MAAGSAEHTTGKQTFGQRTPGVVGLRCVIIGLLLIPVNVYWVIAAELRWYFILTINPLFVTPVFYLFALVGINAVLRRRVPRWALSPAELVVIYVMLVVSCTIATHDFIINLMSTIAWPAWYAGPENRWEALVFPHFPKWLYVWDKQLIAGLFEGNSSLYEPATLKMWLAPLAFWSVFIFTLGWIMLCLTVLLRKAWTEDIKLSFPIVRLPLAMTGTDSEGFFRLRTMWGGFLLASLISLASGLHVWFPNIPALPVRAHWLSFSQPPWTAIGSMCVTLYPFAIGLAFLVPLDVSFSCWFFYLFAKSQAVAGYMLGYGSVEGMPFLTEQGIGAWTAFGVALLYTSRRHLANVFRIATSPDPEQDRGEPMPYKLAFWGLVAGALVFFVFWSAAGMSPLWVVAVLTLYLLLSICITRVRAEAGGQHTVWDLEPMNVFRLFDSRFIGPTNMVTAAASHWYWRLNRSHMMPSHMEAFKLAREHGIRLRSLVAPILLATAAAAIFGMWACLHVFYRDGALAKCQGFAFWTTAEISTCIDNGFGSGFRPEPGRWAAVGAAAGFICLLTWLRSMFAWFPFHPLGYCIGPGLLWLWCPFLIAWAVKLVMLRYGGLKLYRQAVPFFLGMVLGDYTCGALWSLISLVFQIPTHQIFH